MYTWMEGGIRKRWGLGRIVLAAWLQMVVAVATDAQVLEYNWDPAWEVGQYWVVRSPCIVEERVSLTEWKPVQQGYYYSRFVVETVPNEGMVAPPMLRISIKYKVNDDFTYDEQWDSYHLDFMKGTGWLRRISWRGVKYGGEDLNEEMWFRYRTAAFWPWTSSKPPTLVLSWPIVEANPNGQGLAIRTMEEDPELEGTGYWQTVGPAPSGTGFAVGMRFRNPADRDDLRLVFRPGLPWYEAGLLQDDGSIEMINEIVEVGTLGEWRSPVESLGPRGGR